MGAVDWADLDDGLSAATLARGVTGAIAAPAGGSGFVYGYHSVASAPAGGAAGKLVSLTGFQPTGSGPTVADGGCSIRGCLQRVPSPGATGMSPMLFACAQGGVTPSVNDYAYLVGLSDSSPYSVMLAKAPIVRGLVAGATDLVTLRTGSAQYVIGDALWHHLRLDAIVQPNGDVLLQVFANDLTLHPLGTAPDWQAIAGMSEYIDDVLMINTGTAPLWGGCLGFAFAVGTALNRRGAFTELEAYRQT
jgi:hypothetical protein